MRFDLRSPPDAGTLVSIVPGLIDDPVEAVSPVAAKARASGAVVTEVRVAASGDTVPPAIRRGLTERTAGERFLKRLPELVGRLRRPWSELSHAERYLTSVAHARVCGADLVVLELPSSRLPGPRVVSLVADLVADGLAVLWIERRIRLLAAFDAEAWLVDDGVAVGPLRTLDLMEDHRALRLCFGSTLDPV